MVVKICGITRAHDAKLAYYRGADLLGLIFHPASPRFCGIGAATEMLRSFPDYPWVFVFSYDDANYIQEIRKKFSAVDAKIQIPATHRYLKNLVSDAGYENVIPVVGVQNSFEHDFLDPFSAFSLIVLDTAVRGDDGRQKPGPDDKFTRHLIKGIKRPHLLTGGLTPDNLEGVICDAEPYGVDVAGGIEKSSGIKDDVQLEKFMRIAKKGRGF